MLRGPVNITKNILIYYTRTPVRFRIRDRTVWTEPLKERTLEILKQLDRYAGIPALHALAAVRAAASLVLPPRRTTVRSILMVKLWGVGNLVMIIPLIKAVRRAFPEAQLHFLTLEQNADLLAALPELDGIATLKTRGLAGTMTSLAALPFKLQRLKPDLYLDFEQFLRISPILGLLSGAPQRVGLNTPGQHRAVLYNGKVPYRIDRHMTLTFSDIVRSAGVDVTGIPALEVCRDPAAAIRIDGILGDNVAGNGAVAADGVVKVGGPPVVVIHPGSGDNFPARRWPVAHFAEVAEILHREAGARIIVTGTLPERDLAQQFGAACTAPVTDLTGALKLRELVELLARVDLLVTNDTAPVHISSALRRPLIALYGPNTPDLYGPLNEEARAFYLRFPCSPCITNMNAKTSRCQMPECITQIDPARVASAALRMLASDMRRGKEGVQRKEEVRS